ncbi:MAG: hypothetical protein Q7S32_01835 [bacterium]|nr:hypothetical protein [bacterium]
MSEDTGQVNENAVGASLLLIILCGAMSWLFVLFVQNCRARQDKQDKVIETNRMVPQIQYKKR